MHEVREVTLQVSGLQGLSQALWFVSDGLQSDLTALCTLSNLNPKGWMAMEAWAASWLSSAFPDPVMHTGKGNDFSDERGSSSLTFFSKFCIGVKGSGLNSPL